MAENQEPVILDANLSKRWSALFPISEGNVAGLSAPVSKQITPVVVLNPTTLLPVTLSSRYTFAAAESYTIYTIPKGFHLIITYMEFYKAVNVSNVVVSDSTTQVWNIVQVPVTPNTIQITNIYLEILNTLVLYSSTAGELNWNINGFLERISNI